jgi:hypothetical protein
MGLENKLSGNGEFASFREEKEHYSSIPEHVYQGIDSDIRDIIMFINQDIDFAYTFHQSCSASTKDHKVNSERGRYFNSLKDGYDHLVDRSKPFGHLELRVDTESKNFPRFKEGLENLGLDIYIVKNFKYLKSQLNEGIYNKADVCLVIAPVPDEVDNPSHPEFNTYLSDKWSEVYDFVEQFHETTESIKKADSIKKAIKVQAYKMKMPDKKSMEEDKIKRLLKNRQIIGDRHDPGIIGPRHKYDI